MTVLSNVTLKQVRAFVAVARSRSFAEAASQVHLSQPALSMAIKNLEEIVGGQLLTRTTRSFALTPEGESFYPTALRLLSEWDGALADLGNRFSLKTGRVAIAAMPSFAANLLPAALKTYKQEYPNIKVSLRDVVAEEVVRMVRAGQVEIGVSFYREQDNDLDFLPLFEDRFMAVLPRDHPLVSQKEVGLAELLESDLIMLQAPSQVREWIVEMIQRQGLSFAPDLESHQLVTVGRMVASGLGVSIVPALCERQMADLGACCRPIAGEGLTEQLGILTHRRYPLSAASRGMLEILQRSFA